MKRQPRQHIFTATRIYGGLDRNGKCQFSSGYKSPTFLLEIYNVALCKHVTKCRLLSLLQCTYIYSKYRTWHSPNTLPNILHCQLSGLYHVSPNIEGIPYHHLETWWRARWDRHKKNRMIMLYAYNHYILQTNTNSRGIHNC